MGEGPATFAGGAISKATLDSGAAIEQRPDALGRDQPDAERLG